MIVEVKDTETGKSATFDSCESIRGWKTATQGGMVAVATFGAIQFVLLLAGIAEHNPWMIIFNLVFVIWDAWQITVRFPKRLEYIEAYHDMSHVVESGLGEHLESTLPRGGVRIVVNDIKTDKGEKEQ